MRFKFATSFGLLASFLLVGTLWTPTLGKTDRESRKEVLQGTLFMLRSAISQFHYDIGRSPKSLKELVDEGYLRNVPSDPFTGTRDTWITAHDDSGGIVNVWSGAAPCEQHEMASRCWGSSGEYLRSGHLDVQP
jgi:general secretion pathway protein G